jgi:hypothetical protein
MKVWMTTNTLAEVGHDETKKRYIKQLKWQKGASDD